MKKILFLITLLGMMLVVLYNTSAMENTEIAEIESFDNEIRGEYIGYYSGQYTFRNVYTQEVESVYGGGNSYNFMMQTCYAVQYFEDCIGGNGCQNVIIGYQQIDCTQVAE